MTWLCPPSIHCRPCRWSLPLGVVVHPMSDEARGRAVPVVNLGGAGIIRCRRCRTYMNPFMGWKEGGRRFQCNVCGLLNEVRRVVHAITKLTLLCLGLMYISLGSEKTQHTGEGGGV